MWAAAALCKPSSSSSSCGDDSNGELAAGEAFRFAWTRARTSCGRAADSADSLVASASESAQDDAVDEASSSSSVVFARRLRGFSATPVHSLACVSSIKIARAANRRPHSGQLSRIGFFGFLSIMD